MKVSGRMIKNKFVEKMLLIYGFRAENIKRYGFENYYASISDIHLFVHVR